jgi:5-methylthioadenosine/S-adenosylhomocysteine deaminase
MLIKNVYLFEGKTISDLTNILVEGNQIKEVGTNDFNETHHEMIDGKGMLALPGLTDSHRHVWQSGFMAYAANMMLLEYLNKTVSGIGSQLTANELYTLNLFGYLQAAASGVTTLFDWCHAVNSPEHAEAAIQAAIDSNINVLFFHSTSAIDRDAWWYNSQLHHDKDFERIVHRYNGKYNSVKVGMGIRGPEFSSMEVTKEDIARARSIGVPVSMHIGSSVLGKSQPLLKLAQEKLLGSDLNLVHCNTLSNNEFKLMEKAGCLVSITPEAELQMGLGYPIVKQLHDFPQLKWSIGLDIITAAANNLMYQQQLLLQLYRGYINERIIAIDILPIDMPFQSDSFYYKSMMHASTFASFSSGQNFEEGAQANIVLFDWSDLSSTLFKQYPAFHFLSTSMVKTVIADGQLVMRNGEWMRHDYEKLQNRVHQIVQRLYKQL